MEARLVLPCAAVALALAGCAESSGSSSSDPAALAPPESPLFIAATLRPEGELKTNADAMAQRLAGVDDLGELIVSELEGSADASGDELDLEKEVEPWLGEKGGLFFQRYDGDDFSGYGAAIETTDPTASEDFIERQIGSGEEPVSEGSYEGADYKVQSDDGTTVGVLGDFVAIAEDVRTFKRMVDAAAAESLADEDAYARAVDAADDGGLADVFVDIGGLIEQSGGAIDPNARQFLDSAGIEPEEATAIASLIPGSDQIEIDFVSDLGGRNPPRGDASGLLGSLPAESVAAIAGTDFGTRLEEALDRIDANGIPGQVPPGKLKGTLKEAGVDLERIAASIGDLGIFVEGSGESDLAGAAVLTTEDAGEARNTVSNIGLLLRVAQTPGVTAIPGKLSGFSVRSEDLGPKPLVVAAQGERIAIAYGFPAASRVLATGGGSRLADDPTYEEAVAALGGTPISGFADGPAALRLTSSLIAGTDDQDDFEDAKPYLAKIEYLAIGAGSSGELATAKLIAGVDR